MRALAKYRHFHVWPQELLARAPPPGGISTRPDSLFWLRLKDSTDSDDEEATLISSLATRFEIQLGFAVNSEVQWDVISELELFDLDEEQEIKQYQPGFKVSRQPTLATASELHQNFLKRLLAKARWRHPNLLFGLL